MFGSITVARPYAQAAFNFAIENKQVEHWQGMLEFVSSVACNQQISGLLSKTIGSDILFKVFIAICGDHLDEYGRNFIHIMAKNRRLLLLPTVLQQFIKLRVFLESIVEVNILSASILSDEQKAKIVMTLEKRLSRKVKLNCKIDKSILAGMIVRFEDIVIDGCVRSRLERLKSVLQF